MELNTNELKSFLEEKVQQYNTLAFIKDDPIAIPHSFSKKEDIEIAAFFSATIAWGNRKSIMTSARSLMKRMDNAPHDFILNHTADDLGVFDGFVHRTFQQEDLIFFVTRLQKLYKQFGGLEMLFTPKTEAVNMHAVLFKFHELFFAVPHPKRTTKHVANPAKKSAAKRLHMFLRWMVRSDAAGIDLGIWKSIPTRVLSCPLDIHSGNVARSLGLLQRKQNDLAAVIELDNSLRKMDPEDPVKYDYALFGLGVFEGF
ncbi:MAG: TIGR02757 family protein [Flavobacteriaceae bacterium]|nr:TIGR02757 family protein [Flavobacteriaceae bacterium]MBJ33089.1 TIGR02757 family protein [Flavobacteriaceae bacterium]